MKARIKISVPSQVEAMKSMRSTVAMASMYRSGAGKHGNRGYRRHDKHKAGRDGGEDS